MCLALVLCAVLAGCSSSPLSPHDPAPLEAGRLPVPDTAVRIHELGPCTDSPDRTLRFDADSPVAVLVHGCNGSAGEFRSLAELYAFHGQQAVCFSYDDRDSLVPSARRLVRALEELAHHLRNPRLAVIGHSMGGLVARRAMEQTRGSPLRDVSVDLVTVSAPVAGIAIAGTCGVRAAHWLSLGVVPAICWAITGANWFEITAGSEFIREPRPLRTAVRRYLKIVTDERDTCRRTSAAGFCLESDFVFSLPEQYHPVIDAYPQLTNIEVAAGHVEIVGYKDVPPGKLLSILQERGVIAPTPPQRRAALERLMARLY